MTSLDLIHLSEPQLEFKYGQTLVYPRDGLFLYGPVDGGRPEIHYGAIGTKAGIDRLERWASSLAGFIGAPSPRKGAKAIEPQHVPYPGFTAAFNAHWPVKPKTIIDTIDATSLRTRVADHNACVLLPALAITIVIHIVDLAGVPPPVLREAKTAAADILADIDVSVEWTDASDSPAPASPCSARRR